MSIYCWPCASCPLSWCNCNNPTDFCLNALIIIRAQQRPLSLRFAKSDPIVRLCIKVGVTQTPADNRISGVTQCKHVDRQWRKLNVLLLLLPSVGRNIYHYFQQTCQIKSASVAIDKIVKLSYSTLWCAVKFADIDKRMSSDQTSLYRELGFNV
ncbi:hypothetical protein CEXT_345891 [Caerostris extrusa]|uniref:Uncharacterized protein n=1 Tax=Caerostris extrusa TaxID=172846 RepID=A0AAV4TBI4_CAEEX|nr:hypothetical protein CEXT_345891 [Caerostris extrusa]